MVWRATPQTEFLVGSCVARGRAKNTKYVALWWFIHNSSVIYISGLIIQLKEWLYNLNVLIMLKWRCSWFLEMFRKQRDVHPQTDSNVENVLCDYNKLRSVAGFVERCGWGVASWSLGVLMSLIMASLQEEVTSFGAASDWMRAPDVYGHTHVSKFPFLFKIATLS